ncbi:carbon-nitrogen family hydrolase [Bacillus alkalicellulosilyticus]|uniref:carbon-nitrogen family hydrolase n=1 Tax=Alkalihalobacterium alkalicellulosilyticum TaxID=1912214 RepID=UPI0009973811|nr:carbon-nitrogen family hydrolase [Bacillus alkalicellulosilyticus]
MRVAIYQMDIIPGNPKANQQKVRDWIQVVMEGDGADVLVLPEMWTTAYTLTDLAQLAEEDTKETIELLSHWALMYNVNIVAGSIATKENDNIYNRAFIFNREGKLVHQYDKMHLVPMLDEHLYLKGGREQAITFELDGVKMGVIICYDLRFPELARSLALEGAQVLFLLAEWPEARKEHWKHLQIARAIENQMYVVSSNRVGTYNDVEFCGRSKVITPWGEVIAQGSASEEQTITAELKLEEVTTARKIVPVFESRVPNLYKRL